MRARLRSWLAALVRRTRLESEMDEELRFHLEARADDLARAGVPRGEAERRARLEFGNVECYKEHCREARGLRWPDELRQDLRFAFRSFRRNPGFTAVAVVTLALEASLTGAGEPVRALDSSVTASFFPLPGVEPALGRWFPEGEEAASEGSVAILSDAIWRSRFRADPGAIGRVENIDGVPHTIVGVMPAHFNFPPKTQLWTRLRIRPAYRDNAINKVMGRLADGVSPEQAFAQASTLMGNIGRTLAPEKRNEVTIVGLQESMVGKSRRLLMVLLGAVGCPPHRLHQPGQPADGEGGGAGLRDVAARHPGCASRTAAETAPHRKPGAGGHGGRPRPGPRARQPARPPALGPPGYAAPHRRDSRRRRGAGGGVRALSPDGPALRHRSGAVGLPARAATAKPTHHCRKHPRRKAPARCIRDHRNRPGAQESRPFFLGSITYLVRAQGDPAATGAALRAQVRALDSELPVQRVELLDDMLSGSLAQPRFRTAALLTFALLALLVALVGIYGLTTYEVTRRTAEIGIRRALGAQTSAVLRLVVGRSLGLVLAGLFAGILGALAVTRVLESFLFGVTPIDVATFLVVSLAVTAAATLASAGPARRATRVDPAVALRND
jgi:hypothetical protein